MAKMKTITKWMKKFRGILFFLLILAVVTLSFRTVYLEVKVHSYPGVIHELDREINELHKSNAEWKKKYEECSYDPIPELDQSLTSFGDHSAKSGGEKVILAKASSP